jgi:lycopene cyclase domain-containing protein
MIPERAEYLFLLALYFVAVLVVIQEATAHVLRRAAFWSSCLVFVAICSAIEAYALRHSWWKFSPHKICGILIGSIPIEEYLLFILTHLSTSAIYSALRESHDLD